MSEGPASEPKRGSRSPRRGRRGKRPPGDRDGRPAQSRDAERGQRPDRQAGQRAAAARERRAEARRAVVVPPITYPEALPVSARRAEIADAIRDHQVVVVAGETGSGKTTQLPKILLELGYGRTGQIGHTQPRRIAARAVAERISEELTGGRDALGSVVGYQVRFTDQSSEQTLVKVMTDGILLAQIQRDPDLLAYDALIIDEAHERSLNIDFLLGYLTRLLPRRPDLRLVITSATIDSERFARHFGRPAEGTRGDDGAGGTRGDDEAPGTPGDDRAGGTRGDDEADVVPAPVVEVTGRTFPVEVRYRPLAPDPEPDEEHPEDAAPTSRSPRAAAPERGGGRGARRAGAPGRGGGRGGTPARGDDARDLMTAICEAVDELSAEGPGDILVFLSGEREIRDADDALRAHLGDRLDPRHPRHTELLPLYSRLSGAEQHRVFESHPGRRVVLATNIAETSLTVPGVRYVVDPGTARISRWSKATKVQRLPIEPISQASARQRSGRCGRVADGVAIRLYSEADFDARPEFTEPEILRTSLASVILQMIAVGVAASPEDVATFPFVDQPDTRAVRDGVQLLLELGALATPAERPPSTREPTVDGGTSRGRWALGARTGEAVAAGTGEVTAAGTGEVTAAGTGEVTAAGTGEATAAGSGEADGGAASAAGGAADGGAAGAAGGAVDGGRPGLRLTEVGRALAQLPIDPRLARMIVEGGRRGVAREVMIIAAALSIQDPRERPSEEREQADAMHRRFADPTSDLLAYLNLWHYVREQQRELSGSAFRRMCRAEYLSFLRLREWQDVVTQLKQLAKPLHITVKPAPHPAPSTAERPPPTREPTVDGGTSGGPWALADRWDAEAIHRSVLAGLLSQIGQQEATEVRAGGGAKGAERDRRGRARPRNEYLGARGARFAIFPGSALARKPPAWVMAGELVETSRLWARDVARIEPEWAEELAAHLVKRTYSEPTWSAKQGAAMATERVTLYGVPIVTGRRVLFAKVDPEHARELFLRHALVEGDWTTHHRFFHTNRALLAQAAELEERARRRDLVVDDDALFAFYDERVPADVVSAPHFDTWWKGARRREPDLLTFDPAMLLAEDAAEARDPALYPDRWPQGDLSLPLTYAYDPGTEHDGVTVHIPIQVLDRVVPDGFDRLVPGMQAELAVAMIRALPKPVRVQLVPAPDVAAAVVGWLAGQPSWADTVRAGDAAPSWHATFAQAVRELRDVEIPPGAFDDSRLPAHLRMTFRVVEDRRGGRGEPVVVDEGHDLVALQRRLAARSEHAMRSAMRDALRRAIAERDAGLREDGASGDGAGHGPGAAGRTGAAGSPGAPSDSAAGTTGTAGSPGAPSGGAAGTTGSARTPSGGATPAPRPGPQPGHDLERTGLTTWPDLAVIPERVEADAGGLHVEGFPTLVAPAPADRTGPADLRVLSRPDPARHAVAVRELLLGEVALSPGRVTSRWNARLSLALGASPYPSTPALVLDLQRAALDALLAEHHDGGGATVRDRAAYVALRDVVRDALEDRVLDVATRAAEVLVAARDLDADLRATSSLALLSVVHDLRGWAGALVGDGFVARVGADRLPHLVRYLRGARHRLAKAAENLGRDEGLAWQVHELADEYDAAVAAAAARTPDPEREARLAEVRWMLEELRVSLFAQHLGTPQPVSAKRIRTALAAL